MSQSIEVLVCPCCSHPGFYPLLMIYHVMIQFLIRKVFMQQLTISVPDYLSQCLVGFLFQMELNVFNFGSVMSFWIFLSDFPSFSY